MPKMTKQEICTFLNTDAEFDIDGRHCAICPFDSVCLVGNGIEEFGFDTKEEAIEAPLFNGKSIIDLWDIIFPQIS